VTRRNGYRARPWGTRVGRSSVISRMAKGSYFPSLLEPRRRSEQAIVEVVSRRTSTEPRLGRLTALSSSLVLRG
jgi:transposase-like protein